MSFIDFVKELSEVGNYMASVLKDHTYKEHNILYPIALQTFEPGEWKKVREEFDQLGYCRFTPRKP